MSFDPHANFAKSAIATPPSPATSGTTLTLTTGDVAAQHFPISGSFNAVVWPAGAQPTWANAEIVRMTWNTGDQFNIVRSQESTSARVIIATDQIMLSDNVKIFTDIETAITALQTSGFSIDGGAAATSYTGVLKIDAGGAS